MSDNLFELPENLPVPIDDGACVHLLNTKIPAVCLPATSGRDVCLAKLSQWSVLYCYPLTGNWQTCLKLPDGWDQIQNLRNCHMRSRLQHKGLEGAFIRTGELLTCP